MNGVFGIEGEGFVFFREFEEEEREVVLKKVSPEEGFSFDEIHQFIIKHEHSYFTPFHNEFHNKVCGLEKLPIYMVGLKLTDDNEELIHKFRHIAIELKNKMYFSYIFVDEDTF